MEKMYDDLLRQLKPLVLKLPIKEDRQRIASWIKKFNDPNPKDQQWKRTRNLYAQLLKTMLEKGAVGEPFREAPCSRPLPPLPSYMTMFLEGSTYDSASERHSAASETSERSSSKRRITYTPNKTASMPDLSVITTDEDSDEDMDHLLRGPIRRPPTPNNFNIAKMYTSTPGPVKSGGSPIVQLPLKQPTSATSHTMPNYKGIVEKEVQMKERLLSNRYHEEKMKLQRHHDELLQKILDKKTKEVEEFRTEYRNKVLQLENNNKTLERRLQQGHEENIRLRELKERQAFDMKNAQTQQAANLKSEWEKRLTRQEAQAEEGVLRAQTEHQAQLQKLIDDTTHTMGRMEEEYKEQAESVNTFLRECEEKNTALRCELEQVNEKKRVEEEGRGVLQMELDGVKEQLKVSEDRVRELEQEAEKTEKQFVGDLEQLKKSSETAADLAHQDFNFNISKLQETNHTLEQQVKELREANDDLNRESNNKLWEVDAKSKSDLAKLERASDKRSRMAEKVADKKVGEARNEVADLRKALRAKEKEVESLFEAQKLQNLKSERSLQDIRKEMQSNTHRLYKEVQEQVSALEEDLEKAAYERERLEVEYRQRVNEEKQNYEEQVAELKMNMESDKRKLMEKHHQDIADIQLKHDQDKKELEEEKESALTESEKRAKQRIVLEVEKCDDAQRKLDTLNTELLEARASHKKTLNEAVAIREKERRGSQQAGEKVAVAHKTDLEQLKKSNDKEMEKLRTKTNAKIRLLEKEYTENIKQSNEAAERAKTASALHQDETKRQAIMYEKSIKKLYQEVEIVKADEAQRQRSILKALEQEVETQRSMIRHLEKKNRMLELEMEEKLTRTRLLYEERMKGVVPLSVREELEETIAALKAQSTILEQKATILQSELEHRTTRSSPYLRAKG